MINSGLAKSFLLSCLGLLFMFLGCGRNIPEFDQDKAFSFIEKQCSFGPRVPNSDAHRQCEDYLYDQLSLFAERIRKQKFIHFDEKRGDSLYLTNIIASFDTGNQNRILLCTHWDCRPWSDKDPDSSNHNLPVMGANDGASGVAVLLTLAEIFKNNPPAMGIDIILFDGEDYGDYEIADQWLLGSKYFTANIGSYRPRYVIMVDMIADADLDIHKDYYSNTYAGWLVNRIWKAAQLEKAESFYPDVLHTVYDDHVPFLEIGIPAAVIIDLDYDWWHTINDTPDKCSAESLGEVGRVVLRLLYDQEYQ
jgi:hypothetical protein